MPTLAKLARSLAALSKTAWLRLTPTSLQFIIVPSHAGTQVWTVLGKETLFSQYVIESNADNVINLELNMETFAGLLRIISTSNEVMMKLTKRDKYPMLSLSTIYYGKQGGNNTVTHDLHVKVLSSQFISQIREPVVPEPDVAIVLPNLTHLLHISTSFRSLSDKIVLRANMAGKFSIGINTPAVSTFTSFSSLMNPALDPAQVEDVATHPTQMRDSEAFVEMKVDAKDWCNLLRIGSIARRVIALFCEGHALILYVYISEEDDEGSAVLTYYISTWID